MKNKIVYDGRTFEATNIKSGQIHLAASLPSMKLEPNTFTAVVKSDDKSLTEFTRNTPLYYYYRERLVCISYVQTVDRIGPNKYKFYGTSAIGRLIEQPHAGGIYTGQTAEEVITDICGPVPFEIKNVLKKIKLYGWLPYANPPKRSARDNLVQVLFAIGAAIRTDLDGVLRIEGLWDGISGTVGRDKMYTGASTEYDGIVTQVIVTEHQYVPWTEEKQLFEGTAQEGDIITFDEPMHNLTAEGFSILDSGANWAKVSAGAGTLTGKTYIHNTRQVSKDVWPAQEPNVKAVKDATLVSLVNSQACAQRLADYYRCRERVVSSVLYHGELPGDRLATYHPFDRAGVAACLESADITLSNTLKAEEKSLVGFVPAQKEEIVTYDHVEILTGNGTWSFPDGVTSARVVLIGAGSDGESGTAGESSYIYYTESKSSSKNLTSGESGSVSANNSGTASNSGKGGNGGQGGLAGKVFEFILNVSSGEKFPFSCGISGLNSDKPERETEFGSYSSSSGDILPNGYTDIVTGTRYALPGEDGLAGGDGGTNGANGEGIRDALGGAGAKGGSFSDRKTYGRGTGTISGSFGDAGGGGSGGSSGMENGSNGTDARIFMKSGLLYELTMASSMSASGSVSGFAGGDGGNGANGQNGYSYGSGGNGGGGGGGAGQSSSSRNITTTLSLSATSNVTIRVFSIVGGAFTCPGGTGGAGGAGAPGCVILYYGIKKKIPSGQLVDKHNRMVLDRLGRRIIV